MPSFRTPSLYRAAFSRPSNPKGPAMAAIAEILIRARDEASATIARVGDETALAGKKAESGGAGFARFGSNTVVALAVAAAAVASFSTVVAMRFQDAMDKVHGFAGASAKDMAYYQSSILQASTQMGVSATSMADGLYYVVSAGFKGAAAMSILRESTMAAAASHSSFKSVADAVTTTLNAYHLSGTHAKEVTDILSASVVHGKTTFEELATAIARPLTVAPALGVSLAEVGGAMATLTQHGFSARLAGMGLTTMMTGMLAPSAGMQKAADALGVSWQSLYNVHGRGLIETLKGINELALKNSTSTLDYHEKLKALLGTSAGLRTFLAMAADGFKSLKTNTDAAANSAGTTQRAWDIFASSFSHSLGAVGNAVVNLGIVIGDKLLPFETKMAQELKKFIDYVTSNLPAIEAEFGKLGGFMKDIGTAADNVWKALQPFIDGFRNNFLPALATASTNGKAFVDVLNTLKASLSILGDSLHTLGVDLGLVSSKTGDATTKGHGFADLLANVLVDSVKAVVLVVDAMVLAIAAATKAYDGIVKAVRLAITVFKDVATAIEKAWKAAQQATDGGVLGIIAKVAGLPVAVIALIAKMSVGVLADIGTMISSALTKIGTWVTDMTTKAKQAATDFANGLHGIIAGSVAVIKSMVTSVLAAAAGLAGDLYKAGANAGANFVSGLKSTGGALFGAAGNFIGNLTHFTKGHSPTAAGDDFELYGRQIGLQWAAGIASAAPAVALAGALLAATASGALQASTASAAPAHPQLSQGLATLNSSSTILVPLIQAIDQLPPKLQAAMAPVIADMAAKLAKVHSDFVVALRAENTAYQAKLTAENVRHAAALESINSKSNETINHYLNNHAIAINAANQRALLAGQAEQAKYAATRAADLAKLEALHGKHIAAQAAVLERNIAQLDAVHKAHVAHLEAALGIHTKQQQAMLEEWLRHHGVVLDAALAKETAAHAKHVSGIEAAHTAHVTKLQAALQAHVATLKTEIAKLATPAGIWDSLKKTTDDLATNTLKALALAIEGGTVDIGKLSKAAIGAAAGADKMTAAMQMAAAITSGPYAVALLNAQNKYTAALTAYNNAVASGTGNLAALAATAVAAGIALNTLTAVPAAITAAITAATAIPLGAYATALAAATKLATDTLDAYNNAVISGIGDIAGLKAAAISAGIALQTLTAVPGIITAAITAITTPLGAYATALANAQTTYTNALTAYNNAVISGTGDLTALGATAVAAGIALTTLQNIPGIITAAVTHATTAATATTTAPIFMSGVSQGNTWHQVLGPNGWEWQLTPTGAAAAWAAAHPSAGPGGMGGGGHGGAASGYSTIAAGDPNGIGTASWGQPSTTMMGAMMSQGQGTASNPVVVTGTSAQQTQQAAQLTASQAAVTALNAQLAAAATQHAADLAAQARQADIWQRFSDLVASGAAGQGSFVSGETWQEFLAGIGNTFAANP
jgi:TP901 family phage tail tape measure protein